MTSLPAPAIAYTPLESFLLFTYLQSQGADHAAFRAIAALLQENPNVRADPKFDVGRLSADALSDFYLRLLKDEARSDLDRQSHAQDGPPNGDPAGGGAASGQRKRKAPSPSLPTVEEASKNAHLIPQLISKLYARFRSRQVREIREQERKYDELQRELREIEQGRWNDRLQREIQKGQWDAVLGRAGVTNGQRNGVSSPLDAESPRDGLHGQGSQGLADVSRHGAALGTTSASGSTASPSPRPTDRKSPPPKAGAMPPPSTTQRLAPQPSTGSPAPPAGTPGQQPLQGSTPQPSGPLHHPLPHTGPAGTPHVPYAKGSPAHRTPPVGPHGPQPPNTYPRPPHQQPGYRPSRVGGIELPPFQLNSTPTRPTPQQLPPPPGFSTVPAPGQNAQPFIRQADGRMVPLPPPQMLDGIMGGLTRNWKQTYGQKTRWKKPAAGPSAELPSPQRESLSPPPASTKSSKDRKQRPTPSTEHETEPRRGPTRSRRVRGGSVASSAVPSSLRSRTRSQSVTSHMSVDNESAGGRRVKHEPGTPMDDDVSATIEASPGGAHQRSSRRAAGASHQPPLASRKRRRSVHDTSERSEFSAEPPPPPASAPTHVLVSRNFARTCQPVLNDILSHKHASLFSSAVKERDAPGYTGVVLRPQDFKAIRKAISDGSRTVAAALADAGGESPAAAGAPLLTSGHVLLPVAPDLVPPRAIVNSAQLEREVTRVFANAAMYNFGDDPVVLDAREMFDSVQKSMNDWRGAEGSAEMANVPVIQRHSAAREVEDSDDDELAGEPGSLTTGKRRRIG